VTEPDDVLFGRAEMERAFTALGERLQRRGVVADVFVVGGAAMAWPTTPPALPATLTRRSPPTGWWSRRPVGWRTTSDCRTGG
jgi:hypothetical protein